MAALRKGASYICASLSGRGSGCRHSRRRRGSGTGTAGCELDGCHPLRAAGGGSRLLPSGNADVDAHRRRPVGSGQHHGLSRNVDGRRPGMARPDPQRQPAGRPVDRERAGPQLANQCADWFHAPPSGATVRRGQVARPVDGRRRIHGDGSILQRRCGPGGTTAGADGVRMAVPQDRGGDDRDAACRFAHLRSQGVRRAAATCRRPGHRHVHVGTGTRDGCRTPAFDDATVAASRQRRRRLWRRRTRRHQCEQSDTWRTRKRIVWWQ